MRELWHPSWLQFGVKPGDLDDFTHDELDQLLKWLRQLNKDS